MHCLFRLRTKKISKRERVYEAVRQIHITRFLQQIVSDYRERRKEEKKKTNNVLLHIKYSIPLTFQEDFFMSQLPCVTAVSGCLFNLLFRFYIKDFHILHGVWWFHHWVLVYRLFVRKINIFETNKTDTCIKGTQFCGDRSDFVRCIYKLVAKFRNDINNKEHLNEN
jgi:hypothetical protein